MSIQELFDKWKDYKTKIEGKSEKSIDQYIYRLQQFNTELSINTKEDLVAKNCEDIKNWLMTLANNGNSERTRNTKLTAIKEIYKYLAEELDEKIDYKILNIPFAKVPKREVKYIDADDKEDFISKITNLRTKTGAAIIFGCGARYCELMQITCTDIENGYADVIGKGNKERRLWFDLWVQEIAKQYIRSYNMGVCGRKAIVEKCGIDTNLLMISNNGKPLEKWSFSRSMKIYGKHFNEDPLTEGRMDWYNQLSPHKLRHSFATEQLQNGTDIATVRDELGHENIATTNNYVHSNKERVRMAMLKEDERRTNITAEDKEILRMLMENPQLLQKAKEMIEKENNGEE